MHDTGAHDVFNIVEGVLNMMLTRVNTWYTFYSYILLSLSESLINRL